MGRLSARVVFPWVVLLGAVSCIPTAARKNARLEPGLDLDLIGGVQVMQEGVDENGEATDSLGTVHVEVDAQWASTFDNNSGIALQFKVPFNVFFTTIDLYYQLPTPWKRLFLGVGGELSIAPGVYGVITRYLDDEIYVTFTPRLLVTANSSVGINPQLAVGLDGNANIAAFINYVYQTGDGLNIALDFSKEKDNRDFRNRYLLGGVSLRF